MLNERQIKILLYFINKNDWLTSDEVSDYFNVNKKTIQQEIKYISICLSNGLVINTSKHKGYRLEYISEETKKLLSEELYLKDGKNSLTSISSKIVIFLLFYKDYVTMQTLADAFYISKTAVSLKVDVIKRWIKRYKGLSLEVNRQKGIKIHGNELQKRVYCSIHATPSVFNTMPFSDSMKEEYQYFYNRIAKILKNVCIDNQLILTGEDLKKNIRFIVISIIRSKLGYIRESVSPSNSGNFLASEVVKQIHETLECRLNLIELSDIQLSLNQSNTFIPLNSCGSYHQDTKKNVEKFLLKVSQSVGIPLDVQTMDTSLMED